MATYIGVCPAEARTSASAASAATSTPHGVHQLRVADRHGAAGDVGGDAMAGDGGDS